MAKNMIRRAFPRGGIRTRLPVTIYRRSSDEFSPTEIEGLALWLDASSDTLYTTDAGPVVAVASPLDIAGCVGWWDADNAASITESGGLVSQWNDRSGQGNHATASTTARPTTGTRSLNGRNVLDFDGTANGMATSLADTATQTVFFVAVSDVASSAGRVWGFGGGNRGAFPDSGAWGFWRQQTAGAISFGTTASATSPSVACALFSSNSSLTTFGNGAQGTTNDPVDSFGGTFAIGKEASNFHNGYVAEIVIYPTALSTADRARVEAYLATKWGISGVHTPATASSDPVGYWGDRSGNGRHAVRSIGSRRPSVSATAQNGKKTIAFTSASLTGMTAPGGQSMKDGATFCGAYFSGNVNYSMLLNVGENANGTRWDIGSNATRANLSYYPSTLTPQASMSNVTCILTGVFNKAANTVTLRMNGAEIATGTASPALASYASDVIGIGMSNLDNEQHLNGRVFELAAYNQPLLPAQARRLEQYLATRWGITLAPAVANADAQDWINRVYANGGSVSSATASAVNQFCDAIDAASLRSKMLRLNLFCGTGLNACLTPLYRAASLGDTQLGNATDTNVGGLFVSGNYSESGGLVGDGSTKYLKTGLASNQLAGGLTGHAAIWRGAGTVATTRIAIGGSDNDVDDFEIQERTTSTVGAWGKTSFTASSTGGVAGLKMINRSSPTRLDLYSNGSSIANSPASVVVAPHANEFYVFGGNRNGTLTLPVALPVFAYSLGVSMDATQATAYYNALSSFQTSLSRT